MTVVERNISSSRELRNGTEHFGTYKYSSSWLKIKWMYRRNKIWSERVRQEPNPKGLLTPPNPEWLALQRPSLPQESGAIWKGKHSLHPGICACSPIRCEFQGWLWSVSTVWFGCSLLCNRFFPSSLSQLLLLLWQRLRMCPVGWVMPRDYLSLFHFLVLFQLAGESCHHREKGMGRLLSIS